jgi:hypothetical protein
MTAEEMIAECEGRESSLTDWERTFVDSLKARVEGGYALSDGQQDRLEGIWLRTQG